MLLVAELLDRGAQLRVGVEIAGADARFGGDGQERDRLPAPVELCDRVTGALLGGDRPGGSGAAQRFWIVEYSRALVGPFGVAPAGQVDHVDTGGLGVDRVEAVEDPA